MVGLLVLQVEWGKDGKGLMAGHPSGLPVLPQALGVFPHGGSPNLVEVQGNLHGRVHTSVA